MQRRLRQHRRTEFEQMGFQVAFESGHAFAQSNVSRQSFRWMEQQQKKRDGPVRCVREERPAAEHPEERTARDGA